MNFEGLTFILGKIGSSKIRHGSTGWVTASCPLIRAHTNRSDEHPSFGVSVEPRGKSRFYCHACKTHGDLEFLVRFFEQLENRKVPEVYPLLAREGEVTPEVLQQAIAQVSYDNGPVRVGGISVPRRKIRDLTAEIEIDEKELDLYKNIDLPRLLYLTGPERRLSMESLVVWEVGWSPDENRVVLPIRSKEKKLVGFTKRWAGPPDKRAPKYLHTKGFRRDFYLYGECFINNNIKKCRVVEGFFDAIWLKQNGYENAVAIMGSYLSPVQERKILQFFEVVEVMGDGDEAGKKMAAEIHRRLCGRIPITIVEPVWGKDPNDMSFEELENAFGPPERVDTPSTL